MFKSFSLGIRYSVWKKQGKLNAPVTTRHTFYTYTLSPCNHFDFNTPNKCKQGSQVDLEAKSIFHPFPLAAALRKVLATSNPAAPPVKSVSAPCPARRKDLSISHWAINCWLQSKSLEAKLRANSEPTVVLVIEIGVSFMVLEQKAARFT